MACDRQNISWSRGQLMWRKQYFLISLSVLKNISYFCSVSSKRKNRKWGHQFSWQPLIDFLKNCKWGHQLSWQPLSFLDNSYLVTNLTNPAAMQLLLDNLAVRSSPACNLTSTSSNVNSVSASWNSYEEDFNTNINPVFTDWHATSDLFGLYSSVIRPVSYCTDQSGNDCGVQVATDNDSLFWAV